MPITYKGLIKLVCFLCLLILLLYKLPTTAFSATDHIVISEVQIGGDTADEEFVELYNPTDTPFDLTNWRLARKTGTTTSNLVNGFSISIQPHSYLLVAPTSQINGIAVDQVYTTTARVTSNNTIHLIDLDDVNIDTIGMGSATEFEDQATSSPENNTSVARVDVKFDSDNNFADFAILEIPTPQNSLTNQTTPTETPSPTPTPTQSPTPSPTSEPTAIPTPTSTILPSPTTEPLPTATPRTIGYFRFPNKTTTCSLVYENKKVLFLRFLLPKIKCS